MLTFMPFDDFAWSARSLADEELDIQRDHNLQIMSHLLVGDEMDHPAVKMWEGYERALLAYQQAVCNEWSSVRGHQDDFWDKTRLMFLDVIVDPMATPLIPPHWIGVTEIHISHQSTLLRNNKEYYRKKFPGIRDDHPYIWPAPNTRRKPRWQSASGIAPR